MIGVGVVSEFKYRRSEVVSEEISITESEFYVRCGIITSSLLLSKNEEACILSNPKLVHSNLICFQISPS